MSNDHAPRILPFVPLDKDAVNRRIDEEIMDRERAKDLEKIADEKLSELDFERIINGEVEP